MLVRGRTLRDMVIVVEWEVLSGWMVSRAARMQCGVERGFDGWLVHFTSPSGAWSKYPGNWVRERVIDAVSLRSWAFFPTVSPGTQPTIEGGHKPSSQNVLRARQ